MGSYIMHLCISNKVKEKYNLSEKFMYGSILPDIKKEIEKDRSKTHYINNFSESFENKKLPDINRAKKELKNVLEFEIYLGYIAHLIEDYIWFDKYIPLYSKQVNSEEVKYYKDNTIHSMQEYRNNIYSDYRFFAKYIIDKYHFNLSETINSINYLMNESEAGIVLENTKIDNRNVVENTILLTKNSIDNYINDAFKQVDIFVKGAIIEEKAREK